jgi:hypothetical protein
VGYNPEKARSNETKPRDNNMAGKLGKTAVNGARKDGVAKSLGKTANKGR